MMNGNFECSYSLHFKFVSTVSIEKFQYNIIDKSRDIHGQSIIKCK